MEQPPKTNDKEMMEALVSLRSLPDEMAALVQTINENYDYWSKVKYKTLPQGYTPVDLWHLVVADRQKTDIEVWHKYHIHFGLTNKMQQQCHQFDMNFGGSWGMSSLIPEEHKERYLVSSLMEEAISSSQMEGAATTRKVAKDMLRKHITPKDRSQQMIVNNYRTIQFIVEHKEEPLTKEMLLHVHHLMTDGTMAHVDDAGRFRQNDDVVVENGITHEVVHTPPSFEDIPQFVDDLCTFFNESQHSPFIHPIIKGIIIHFMLAYMHPFVDGNGRTSRALFYWYMLKQGYWLTEYLSISRIIYRTKKSYEKSFLYAEADGMDIGYFITYNLQVLQQAFREFQAYLQRKIEERKAASAYLKIPGINERQAEIVKMYADNPKEMLTVKDFQARFQVTATTIKSDLDHLMELGLLRQIALNKVKKGYMKGDSFDSMVGGLHS
jgi:Fic family protein